MSIDTDLEEFDLHLANKCDPFECQFCAGGGSDPDDDEEIIDADL